MHTSCFTRIVDCCTVSTPNENTKRVFLNSTIYIYIQYRTSLSIFSEMKRLRCVSPLLADRFPGFRIYPQDSVVGDWLASCGDAKVKLATRFIFFWTQTQTNYPTIIKFLFAKSKYYCKAIILTFSQTRISPPFYSRRHRYSPPRHQCSDPPHIRAGLRSLVHDDDTATSHEQRSNEF